MQNCIEQAQSMISSLHFGGLRSIKDPCETRIQAIGEDLWNQLMIIELRIIV
jgi:hypothetical protein